jgi:SH3 domain protein
MMNLIKRTFYLSLLLCFFLIIIAALPSRADTRYVSDQLIISVREGRSPEDPAIAYIVSDMPVEVLEEAENHLFVRLADGKEGWVKKKYILAQRPKSMVIEELKIKIQELENQIKSQGSPDGTTSEESSDMRKIYDLKIKDLEAVLEKEKQSSTAARAELKQMKNQHKKLQDDFNKLSKQKDSLSKQNDGSEALNLEIKRLQQANLALNQEIDQIKTNGQPSMLSGGVKWFLIGGGVLLLGILLGRSVRRKNPYSY